MKMKLTTLTAAVAATVLLNAPGASAQDTTPAPAPSAAAPADNQGQGGQGGGRQGGGNMQNFMQRMNDRVKTALKASDPEWAVIQPLLEKVQTLQRDTRGGGGFGRRGGGPGGGGGGQGGNGGPGGNGNGGPGGNNGGNGGGGPGGPGGGGSPESQALRTALDADGTAPEEIKTKLTALRESRKTAQVKLDQAREDLKKVLTLRQEATLVLMGLLD